MTEEKKNGQGDVTFPVRPQLLLGLVVVLALAVVLLAYLYFSGANRDSGAAGETPLLPSEAVAVVNGEEITRDELFAVMYMQTGNEALQSLINRTLILQEAASRGLVVSDEDLDAEIAAIIDESFQGSEENFLMLLEHYGWSEEVFRDDARLNLLLREMAMAEVDVQEEEARDYFEENIALFGAPEEVEARHILLESEEEALEVVALLEEGEDFAELAAERSIDPGTRDRAGNLGFFPRGAMVPPFDEAVFALDIGETSEPVQTDFGYHVIELLDRRGGDVTYADVADEVKDALLEDRMSAFINELVRRLYDEAEIEYTEDLS